MLKATCFNIKEFATTIVAGVLDNYSGMIFSRQIIHSLLLGGSHQSSDISNTLDITSLSKQ
jgi:hypothetical protein